jgi:hypothetical protein
MPHKVITMSDGKYFTFGQRFIETRSLVNADFYLFGTELTGDQINTLEINGIHYKEVPADIFYKEMQFNKFRYISNSINNDNPLEGVTFADFDTYFCKDWSHIFSRQFDLGITVRNHSVRSNDKKCLANGGVIFVKNTIKSKTLCNYAMNIMRTGYGSMYLPEYDEIWQSLEDPKRPEHKRKSRTNLQWWVDQVFLSAIVLKYLKLTCVKNIHQTTFTHDNFIYHLLDAQDYNRMSGLSTGAYIMHLKDQGRKNIANQKGIING